MKKRLSTLICVMAISSFAFAGSFQVGLQGQKQTGMGLIGTGFTVGPSSVFFNPGSLVFLEGNLQLSAGISPIFSSVAFRKEAPSVYHAATDNPMGTPFSLYAAGKLNDKLSLGLGVYTPFGSSTVWEDDWAGRYLIQNISLMSVYVQPSLSYKISDKWGFGVGLVYAYGKVELEKAIPVSGQDGTEGQASLEGSTTALGFNAGLSFRPSEKLELGLTYRSTVTMEMEEGDAKFTVPASLEGNFPPENTFNASLPLPGSVNLGASYQITEKFRAGFDFHYVFWSEYDSLNLDFTQNTPALDDSKNPRLLKDNFIIRVGGEYTLSDKLIVRAGAYYDSPAVEDDYYSPETPDAIKIGLTTGLTYRPMEKLDVDLSFLYVLGVERDVTYAPADFGGTYKYNAVIPGIGFSYRF